MRGLLDTLDGFGTFAPISVSFDKDLDVFDSFARQNDGDPSNDGAYLVDSSTGATVPLDFDAGHFPVTLIAPAPLFANDPGAGAFNLLFPVDGPARTFSTRRSPTRPSASRRTTCSPSTSARRERCILRPVTPLAQERRYALVLTDPSRGPTARPSPRRIRASTTPRRPASCSRCSRASRPAPPSTTSPTCGPSPRSP